MQNKKIVITGKMGSGKSTILKRLNEKRIIYADDWAKEFMNSKNFLRILNQKKVYDLNYIKNNFFKNKKIKKMVESIVHPRFYRYLSKIKGSYIVEIPIYFETEKIANENGFFPDKIIYIDVEKRIRLKRLRIQRKMKKNDILEREQYFLTDDSVKTKTNFIIKNNCSGSAISQLKEFLQ